MSGTVKSYSAKGFGFILCKELDADVYFPKESLQAGLRTRNIAGTAVTFELARGPAGQPQARNLRPVGGVPPNIQGRRPVPRMAPGPPAPSGIEGVKPKVPPACRPPAMRPLDATRRELSPHAGSRAIASQSRRPDQGFGSRSKDRSSSSRSRRASKRSRDRSRSASRRRGSKKRDSSDSSRASSSSSSSSSGSHSARGVAPAAGSDDRPANPEVEAAKQEALEKLQQLRAVEPKEARMKEWRALLRAWHPDKNPDRTEVATAVFQFLQRGKLLIERNVQA